MSRDHVETVRAIYQRYREGDFHASADVLDAHAVLILLGEASDWGVAASGTGMFVGAEAIAAFTRELLKPWAEFTMEAEEIVAAGDTVLVSVHQSGIGRISGAQTELRYFTLWSFRGLKVIRIESFRDRTEALEAVGLRE